VLEEWAEIEGFNGKYIVSTFGNVMNAHRQRLIRQSYNRQGVAKVNLFSDNQTHCRAVALIVCHTFKPHDSVHFDSVINIDGDRSNNHVDNIEPRPHWFVYNYNRQFKPGYRIRYNKPMRDQDTGIEYPNSLAVAVTFGLLDSDIYEATKNNTYTFPTNQFFEFVDF
jgi:hypothetical protein